MQSGSTVHVSGLTLQPTTAITLTNTSLQRNTATVANFSVPHIQRAYQFTNVTDSFKGTIRFNYANSELNGLNENLLSLGIYNASAWSTFSAASRDTAGNIVVTSGLTGIRLNELTLSNLIVVPSVSIGSSALSVCEGSTVNFTATPINGGTAPAYQWKRNGNNVGTNSSAYTANDFSNSDIISCVMTSNDPNAVPTTATSNSITLTVKAKTNSITNISSCTSYAWNGNTYTSSGTYTYHTNNAVGCDSLATLNLTIKSTSSSTTNISSCTSYSWNGNTYTSSGTYTYHTNNAVGCDSLATLNLTIKSTSSSTQTISACTSYSWNGNTYTSSGTYTYHTNNAVGCDSLATLHLTINTTPATPIVSVVNNCNSTSTLSTTATGTLLWSTAATTSPITVSSAGNYTVTQTANGCVSAAGSGVAAPKTSNTGDTTATACGSFVWYGNTYTSSTTPTHTFTNVRGCDSVVTLHLTINPRPTAVISGGASYCAGTIPPTTTLQVLVTTTGSWSGTLSNGQAFSGSGTGSVNITVTNPTVSTTYTVATLVNSGSTCAAQAGDLTGSATIALNARPTAVISGTQTICAGANETANLTVALTGVAPYSVSYSNGTSTTTVTSATNSLTIPVSPTVTTTYTLVSVSDANACSTVGGDVSGSAFVTLNPYTPSSIQGPINVCPFVGRDTILKYTVPAVPGVINYTWVVNSAYIQLVTSATNSTPIAYNSLTGYSTPSNVLYVKMLVGFIQQSAAQIRVKATTRCGTSAYTSFVIVAQLPGVIPYPTASTTDVCPSIGTNVPIIYKITKSVGALQYFWSITTNGVSNPNAHITHLVTGANAGANDTAISVTFDAGFTTSVLSVYTTNDCGIGGTRTLTITRNVPGSPSLISGPGSSCEYMNNSTGGGLIATYSVGAMTGVTSYYWTIPAGSTNISGETTNSISFKYPMTYTGGTISVRAINNCGVGADRSLSIGVGAIFPPSGIDVTPGTCPNRVYTYTVSVLPFGATSLSWTYPAGATISAQTITSISLLYPNTVVDGVVSVRAVSNCRISAEKTKIVKLGACQSSLVAPLNKAAITNDPMKVIVYPNPSTSSFNLQVKTSTNGTFKARVMDVLGREVMSFTGERDNAIKFGNELKAGVYMIEVREGEKVKTVRVVKY